MAASQNAAGDSELKAPAQQAMRNPKPGVTVVDLTSPWSPEDEVLEEFPFDDELTRRFWADRDLCGTMLTPFCVLCYPCCAYLIEKNAADNAYCRWVAVSRDNILIVRKHRPGGCRFSCQDIGTSRKLIPIQNIQDVIIQEPAGTAVCCCVPNTLTTVILQTAASSVGENPQADPSQGHLEGLRNPKRFRDVVMSLKKGRSVDGLGADLSAGAAPALGAGGGLMGPDVLQCLRDIHQTLLSMDQKLGQLPKA
mmetsp:Transcript_66364/g.154212  ORF Transcript_66364/g.154212 Transcript_66364/m.154212 type:complete len:252 (-) Transcript_66364:84-839(-)